MFGSDASPASLENVAHIIQVALTPIFLLSGIAALLSVFATRLARVADQVDRLTEAIEDATPERALHMSARLAFLRRRSHALDAAVVLGAIGGGLTCGAALALFVGALRDAAVASVLFGLFGLAVISTIGALAAFVIEMLMASRGLRAEAAKGRQTARTS